MLTGEQLYGRPCSLQEVVSARKPENELPHHRLHAVICVTDLLRSPPDEPPTANARRRDDGPSHGHRGSSDSPGDYSKPVAQIREEEDEKKIEQI